MDSHFKDSGKKSTDSIYQEGGICYGYENDGIPFENICLNCGKALGDHHLANECP